jgi:predicted pyridoxine 5'-phosphate oxidase superfamily flavin-nucleotide-binding protein
MDLRQYFEETEGIGVLATADKDGKVDAAVYARPHVMDDGTLAFIMRDRLTHHNLQSNPYATYLFVENNPGYNGKRLFLKKMREEKETELLYKLRRRTYPSDSDAETDPKFLVFFETERELPLVSKRK